MRPIDYFDRGAALASQNVFVAGNGRAFTYAEAEVQMRSVAQGLWASGFQPGDSVAVFSPNDPGAVVCMFTAFRAGGAWIPVNVRNAPASNAAYMAYVKTRWLFFHSSVRAETEAVIPHLPELKAAICFDDEVPGHLSLAALCARGTDVTLPDLSDPFGAPDAIFARWPTGGTTGPSKGVEISHRAVGTMIELGLRHYIGEATEDVVHLAVAPITHAAGAVIGIYAAVGGTTIVLPAFDPMAVLGLFLSETFHGGGLDIIAHLADRDDALEGELSGNDMGLLTASGGRGLDALQYLCNRVLNRRLQDHLPVHLDSDGFKERRAHKLRERAAASVG